MAQHMLSQPDTGFVDKRKSSAGASVADEHSRHVGRSVFTANAAGTTTTLVGINADPAAGANTVRIGDVGKIFNSDGTVQEETVVRVTGVAVAASTTVTFSPALAAATASGDEFRLLAADAYQDNESLDNRLNDINNTLYSQANLDKMTQNDKVYALRVNDDPDSL